MAGTKGPTLKNFKLENSEFIELNNLIKFTGLCRSGGIAKSEIAQGHVKVDGQIELRKRRKIRKGQMVEFEGHIIHVT